MYCFLVSDVVETVTFEADSSSKIPSPRARLEVRDRDSRLQNLCILPKCFKKNVVITSKLNFF